MKRRTPHSSALTLREAELVPLLAVVSQRIKAQFAPELVQRPDIAVGHRRIKLKLTLRSG
jgi:hypothetical protein